MNATEVEAPETTEQRMSVTDQARIVSGLLKEYADKLSALNADLLDATYELYNRGGVEARVAWVLDQGELLRKPLSQIISRGSALLEYSRPEAIAEENKRRKRTGSAPIQEHSYLDTLTADELALRMREIEIQLHHTTRLTHELRQSLAEQSRTMPDEVAKLRLAAGLSGMKGGPLRPDE